MNAPATLPLPAPAQDTAVTKKSETARPEPLPKDAILSIEQAAELLGESPGETRDLTSLGLLKHQLIDGERCVWLSDLLAYKRDFDKRFAEYLKSPTSRIDDEMPNPFDVLPEYAEMLKP